MSDPYSIIKPIGFTVASCGYCGAENSAHVYGAFAYKLTCKDYQDLVNRGWRRHGLYLYKPNLRDRLNTLDFAPSKGQRRTIARLNRFIKNQYTPLKISKDHAHTLSPSQEDTLAAHDHSPSPEPSGNNHDPSNRTRRKSFSPPLGKSETWHAEFMQSIHAADMDKMTSGDDWKHFKVTLEAATFSQEKFDLYCEYQKGIHSIKPSSLTKEAFTATVARTSLPIHSSHSDDPSNGFRGYGTYHHCYYIDGKLVAVAVLDILPTTISSDYFYYDPTLACLSLGKYSTLREIALVQEIRAMEQYETMEYYTMGHLVQSAPKTHYKSTYHPSYLLDPETYNWVPYEKCTNLLQSKKYFSFSQLDLFEPRVKGLLMTMVAEKNRMQVKEPFEKGTSPMDVDESDTADALQVHVQEQCQREGSSSDEEHGNSHKRKRDMESLKPLEYMRSGKRPSWTPHPSSDATMPPPGMMDPKDVTDHDLSQLVIFENGKASMLTDSDSFKTNKAMALSMREYYSAVGPSLAPRILIFAH
ncbi:Arginyl-tRNA--protein transferase 1 [Podila epigama]|nr:Arginyl-tRNA--protein transferase 1 [Podila epigama]